MTRTDKWRIVQWRSYKLKKRLIRAVCRRLYRDTNREISNSIVVAGTGRSGTTWLANIIASQIPCRIMFEPFHSRLVKDFQSFHYFHYMRPTEENSQLHFYCHKIFSGNIRHKWIDRQVDRLTSEYRLIKAIRANLFLKWLHNVFPEVRYLFIIRHPCAVVLSRMQLKWSTDGDIEPFLAQSKLVDDFLSHKLDFIKRAKTVEEKHAIIWCISNLIPIKQFGLDRLNVIFYEDLVCQPEKEMAKIAQAINIDYNKSKVTEQVAKPSTTTIRSSAILTGDDIIGRWKTELSPQQINNILSVVKSFALDYLYDDSIQPLVEL